MSDVPKTFDIGLGSAMVAQLVLVVSFLGFFFTGWAFLAYLTVAAVVIVLAGLFTVTGTMGYVEYRDYRHRRLLRPPPSHAIAASPPRSPARR